MPPPKHVVEPTLFERVVEYAAIVRARKVTGDRPLTNETPIIVFCENFYLQFFKNALSQTIETISAESSEVAERIRQSLALDSSNLAAQQRALVALFQDLCELWDDVVGTAYGFVRKEFEQFHEDFLPRLLGQTVSWGAALSDNELQTAAARARDAYVNSLKFLKLDDDG